MKTTRLFSAILFSTMLAASSVTFGQVKIGTNPTTISPNANLEVEAANNQKVIVDKAIGTVQVENLPSGAITDSIVTADPSGVLRQIGRDRLLQVLNLSGSAQMIGGSQAIAQGSNRVNFTAVTFDQEGGADLAGDIFTVQRDGFYTVNAEVRVQIPLAGTADADGSFSFFLQKIGSGNLGSYNSPSTNRGFFAEGQLTELLPCVAGDRFQIVVIPCSGCGVGQNGYTITNSSLTLVKNF
ncbi:hypothetical protein [Dyadobacter alkalitolerans]|uniref:hypothetical protein n=1 Tax=Dyadobacter alkalitolerans TaxID=492736 RepID=UPI0004228E85|nr:hypothetical protein [Dyadobacter alkalitolerans]